MASFQPVRLAFTKFEPVEEADQNACPIIYLHGMTAFKETWEEIPQVVANATKRLSYSIDCRNHGESEWSDEFNFDMNVEDLIHFMDAEGIKKAIIVGHSMGGITAIHAALKKPERVEKIVVEDMIVRRFPQHISNTMLTYISLIRKAIEEIPVESDEDEAKLFIIEYTISHVPPEMKELAEQGRKKDPQDHTRFLKLRRLPDGGYAHKCNLEVIERGLRKMDIFHSEPEGVFEGPACFIYGKLSPFLVGADEHHIKQFFPNATLEGIEDVSHDVHNSKPLEFTDALRKFLS